MTELLQTPAGISTSFLLAGLAGLGYLFRVERERTSNLEARLNQEKALIYREVISAFTHLFSKEIKNGELQSDQAKKFMRLWT